jgi:asparagine synthase (glutamine-hydrolysing)
MCGIGGVIDSRLSPEQLRAHGEALVSGLRHRGPDGSGIAVLGCGAVLAHTRLSIIDPTEVSGQPFRSASGTHTIVFNGEIYNFRHLRDRLEREGATFRTEGDTEVLLELIRRHGTSLLGLMRGMFAFCVVEETTGNWLIVRDPFGIKPLYIIQDGPRLAFASEVRALLSSGLAARVLDPVAMRDYLMDGYVSEPRTIIEGVRTLAPGCFIECRDGVVSEGRFWQPPTVIRDPDYAFACEPHLDVLEQSVRSHFISDVPVGIFLSGGIDSSTVACVARSVHDGPIRSFSIGFDDAAVDESALAARVAKEYGLDHTAWRVTGEEGKAHLPDFLSALDQPSADGYNTWLVSKLAHDHGMKVMLSGLGGDEFFNGYPSFRRVPKLLRLGKLMALGGPLSKAAACALHDGASRSQIRRVAEFLSGAPTLPRAWRCLRGIFTGMEADKILRRYGLEPPAGPSVDPPEDLVREDYTILERIGAQELSRYMRCQLLRDSDVMSMAHGLELRVPFVDSYLADTILSIPGEIRLQPRKSYLIGTVGNLPPWLTTVKKQGFVVPIRKWMVDAWAPLFVPIRRRLDGVVPLEAWARQYSLLILEQWLLRNGFADDGPEGLKGRWRR